MLWVDKYRPKTLQELDYHDTTTQRLEALVNDPSTMPHLFVYGPSGAGKQTRIRALLAKLYGSSSSSHGLKMSLSQRTFTTPTKRTIEINMISSNYHIELCPGDAGLNDRWVVQELIKEMASNKNLSHISNSKTSFKVVVLREVDRLSRQAQAALRRTMEKYSSTCRLILVSNAAAKVMEPVRSRCLGIRIAAPTIDEIANVLIATARKEKVTLPDALAVNIARESSRNLRRALLMLEASYVQHRDSTTTSGGSMPADAPVQKTDWELYIAQLAVDLSKEQSPQRLLVARERLYELLVHCIPATVILKTLVQEILFVLDDSLKPEVLEWAAFYEHRIASTGGNKEIFHLEAFCCKYMAIYKRYLTDMFG